MGDPLSPEGIDKLWRQSPLRNVANVHTPLLMVQGEADLRCPAADNEQFFIALQAARPDRRVRPLPRRVPRLRQRRPAGPPDRPAGADARLVRPLPARLGRAAAPGAAPRSAGPRRDGRPAPPDAATPRRTARSRATRTSRRGTRRRRRRRPRSCPWPDDVPWRPRSGPAPSPSRARTVAPFAPRLTTAIDADSSSPSTAWWPRNASASAAVANSRSGAMASMRSRAARRPSASSGPIDARSRLTTAPAARASSMARRPASPSGCPISE